MARTGPQSEHWVQKQLDLASINAKRNKSMLTCKLSRSKKGHSDGFKTEASDQIGKNSSRDIVCIRNAKLQQNRLPDGLMLAMKSPRISEQQVPTVPTTLNAPESKTVPPAASNAEMDPGIHSFFAKWSMDTGQKFERDMKMFLDETKEKTARSFKGLVFW